MRKRNRLILAFALLSLTAPAGAQGLGMGMGAQDVVVRAGGGAVVRPGDIASFSVWWGLRAYSNARMTGTTNAIRLRRASDNLEADIKITTTGDLDIATAAAHCAATTCFMRFLYDQAGTNCAGATACSTGHVTLANQPEFVFDCGAGKPCIRSTGTHITASTGTFTPATGVVSLYVVGGVTSGALACALIWQNNTNGNRLNTSGANGYNMLGGTSGNIVGPAGSAAPFRPVIGIINGAASTLNVNGTVSAPASVVGSTVAATTGGYRGATDTICSNYESGYVDNVVLNATQQNALISSARSYYGLP